MADESKTLAWQLLIDTKGLEESARKSASALQSIATAAKFTAGAVVGIASSPIIKGLMGFADELIRTRNQLEQVVPAGEAANQTMEKLRIAAQDSGIPIETQVSNFRSLSQALKTYKVTQDEVIRITNTSSKMIQMAGGDVRNIESNIKTLSMAFNQNTLVQRQWGALLREMPGLADQIIAALGDKLPKKTRAGLQEMISDGKLTGRMLIDALGGAADEIDAKWAKQAPTFARSFVRVRNTIIEFLEKFEQSTGFFENASNYIQLIANNMHRWAGQAGEFFARLKEEGAVLLVTLEGMWANLASGTKALIVQVTQPFVEFWVHVKAGFQLMVNDVSSAYTVLIAGAKLAVATIIVAIMNFGSRVKAGFELVVNDIGGFFGVLLASTKEWIGKLAGVLAGLVPDWATGLSENARKFRDFFSGLEQNSKGAAEAEKQRVAQNAMNISTRLGKELIANEKIKAGLAEELAAAKNTSEARQELIINERDQRLDAERAWLVDVKNNYSEVYTRYSELIDSMIKENDRLRAERGIPKPPLEVPAGAAEDEDGTGKGKKGADQFATALRALQAEYDKTRISARAIAIEIENGTAAMKEFTLAEEKRRATEEKIAALRASEKGISEAQVALLRAQTEQNIKAAVATETFGASWELVKTTMEAGMTVRDKTNKQLADTEAAIAAVSAALAAQGKALSPEQLERFRKGLQNVAEAGDPVIKVTKELDDIQEQLTIRAEQLRIEITKGETAGKAYAASAQAEVEMRKRLEQAVKDGIEVGSEEYNAIKARIEAHNEENESLRRKTEAWGQVNSAIATGMTDREKAEKAIRQTAEGIEMLRSELEKTPEGVAKLNQAMQGLERMKQMADPIRMAWEGAVGQMGQSFTNFIIDGNQSFREFATNAIKEMGRVIAQAYMLKAVKMALGLYAEGGVFEHGRVLPFEHGGLVTGPTSFPLAGGQRGLMGEAGPEAVMPLARLPSGDLGVQAKAAPVNLEVINATGVQATARVKTDSDRTQLILEAAELGATMAQSRFTSSVASGYGTSATTMQRTYGLTRRKA